MLNDYKCKSCGNETKDVWTTNSKDEVICDICEKLMERQFSGLVVQTPSKTERNVPDGYKPQGGAGFGKLN